MSSRYNRSSAFQPSQHPHGRVTTMCDLLWQLPTSKWGGQQEVGTPSHVRFLLNDLCGPLLTMATGTAGTAVTKWHGHMMSHYDCIV